MQSSLQERVEQAAQMALNRNGSVGPLELFQEMRPLQPVHVEGWRKGNERIQRVLAEWSGCAEGLAQELENLGRHNAPRLSIPPK